MRIAVYIERFSENIFNGNRNFLNPLINHTAQLYPEAEFILITTKSPAEKIITEKNITRIGVAPVTDNTFLWKVWLNFKIPSLLKKYKADIFVCDGFCSMKTKIPQCLLITDHTLFTGKGMINKRHAYKKKFSKFYKRAKSVICFSNFIKNEITTKYGEDMHKLKIISPAVEEIFTPLDDTDKNKINQFLTQGSEYFIYTGQLHAEKYMIGLLKAFSIFKKMQQSNMKLVLAGKITSSYKKLIRLLQTYKYREAIILKADVSDQELAGLLGAAYASVLPFEASGVDLLQAMKSGSPVISVHTPIINEIAEDSVLYFNAEDHSDLAAQMMHLYKNEDLRKTSIEKGKRLAMNYNMNSSAKLLWQIIEDTLN